MTFVSRWQACMVVVVCGVLCGGTVSCRESHAEQAERVCSAICTRNLKDIYAGLERYSRAHGGLLPGDFAVLIEAGELPLPKRGNGRNCLQCPAGTEKEFWTESRAVWAAAVREGQCASYRIVKPGAALQTAERVPIVVEVLEPHLHDYRFVLYSDGTIEKLKSAKVAEMLRAMK